MREEGLRILFLPEYFLPQIGGGEVWHWNVARNLAKFHEITVLTYRHPLRRTSEVVDGVRIVRMGPFPVVGAQSYFMRASVQIPFSLLHSMKEEFDLVLASQTLPLHIAKAISSIRRKPLVSIFYDVYGLRFSLKDKGLVKGLIRASLEAISLKFNYDAVMTISQSTKEKLVRSGVREDRIHVVYGGVDLEMFDRVKEEKSDLPVVLYVGRLVRHKRVDLLLRCFREVVRSVPRSVLWIVGDGPERNRLEVLAGKLNISERVKFYGWVPEEDKVRAMKRAWCLVLPSIKEGLGLVLLESMACRTPVIAVDSGGPRDVVVDGINGFLISPEDVNGLTSCITRVLLSEGLRDSMGAAGRSIVESRFTWEKVAERVNRVLLSVVGASRC